MQCALMIVIMLSCVDIKYIDPFFAWQITVILMKPKLIKLLDTWTQLCSGAKNGLEQIFNVKSQTDFLKKLTTIMDSVYKCLGIEFKSLLGKKMSLKTVEHALCEFDKYARAASSKWYLINLNDPN